MDVDVDALWVPVVCSAATALAELRLAHFRVDVVVDALWVPVVCSVATAPAELRCGLGR